MFIETGDLNYTILIALLAVGNGNHVDDDEHDKIMMRK